MKKELVIVNKVKSIQFVEDIDLLRFEMYGIFTTIILSKEIFKNNKEIKNFIDLFSIDSKPYMLKSRTIILSKVIRHIEKIDKVELVEYRKKLKEIYITNKYESNTISNKKEKNYMETLLKKYSRNKEI